LNNPVIPVESAEEEVVETELGIVHAFSKLTVPNAVSGHLESFANGVEMKTNDAWRQSNRRDAALRSQTPHGRLTNLKNCGELLGGQKLFTLFGWFSHRLQGPASYGFFEGSDKAMR
jgi:hypothetical protein